MSCQSPGRMEGAHPGGPSGVLGGGQGVSRAIAVCRPAGPQRFLWTVEGIRTGRGESGVALQPRAGNRGEVGGSGLRDVGVECWADGQGGPFLVFSDEHLIDSTEICAYASAMVSISGV